MNAFPHWLPAAALVLAVATGFAAGACAPGDPPTITPAAQGQTVPSAWAAGELRRIEQLHAAGRIDEALAAAEAIAAREPNAAEIHYTLGVMRGSKNDLDAAVVQFQAELAGNPAHLPSLKGLATAYDNLGQPALAAQTAERFLASTPSDRPMALLAGRSLVASGRPADAERWVAPIADAGDSDALVIMAAVAREAQDEAKAEALLRRALAADASNPEANRQLGQLLVRTSRGEEGERLLARHAGLATLRDAREAAQASVAQAGAGPEAYIRLGDVLRAQGDVLGADAAYRQALAQDGSSLLAMFALAEVALDQGKGADAARWAERAVGQDAANAQAQLLLGAARLHTGDRQGAEAAFEASRALRAWTSASWRSAGDAYRAAGDLPAAGEAYAAALAEKPDDGRALLGLGIVRLAEGDGSGARDALAQAAESAPDDPAVAMALSAAHAALGDAEAAEAAVRDAGRRADRVGWIEPEALGRRLAGAPDPDGLVARFRAAMGAP